MDNWCSLNQNGKPLEGLSGLTKLKLATQVNSRLVLPPVLFTRRYMEDMFKCMYIDGWKLRIKAAWWILTGKVNHIAKTITPKEYLK